MATTMKFVGYSDYPKSSVYLVQCREIFLFVSNTTTNNWGHIGLKIVANKKKCLYTYICIYIYISSWPMKRTEAQSSNRPEATYYI